MWKRAVMELRILWRDHAPMRFRMTEDVLTDGQRKRLVLMLHDVLVEIRMSCRQGEYRRAEDLANAVESLPGELYGLCMFRWEHTEGLLRRFQGQHPGRAGVDYVRAVREIRRETGQDTPR